MKKENTPDSLSIGATIFQYRILEEIGTGSMGEVFLGEDTNLKRQVALKFLTSQHIYVENFKARFKREARAAAMLNHPNIITIYEVNEYEGRPFIAMEYAEGELLAELIKSGDIPAAKVIDITLQICEGLREAHKFGIVHRDIKPANVKINNNGICKILDFGLAAIQTDERLTRTKSLLGTIEYMSPEQVRGEMVDHRSDIFSLGVLSYEMLTGQLPFKGDYVAGVIYSIINEVPEVLDKSRSDIPPEFQSIIDKALEKDLGMRYQNIEDLRADLGKLRSRPGLDSSTSGPPSIAVLPFKDMSAQKDQEYFCDGMAEEIINALASLENIHVVARTSSFSFKGQDIDIREIGRKLKVTSILEGSVRKSGEKLRITAQLINVSDGFHLWSERYDRTLDDIFAIQDDIAVTVVNRLETELLGKDKAKLERHYTDNLEAHNLYLKGRYFWNKRTEDDLNKAIKYFKRALEIDPEYARAYAGLSDVYYAMVTYSYAPAKESYPKAREAALKALMIDNSLAEAHVASARVKGEYDWNWAEAEEEIVRAIKLNPGYATAHQWYSAYLSWMARFDEAIEEVKLALELDPLSLAINRTAGMVFYYARRYDKAIEAFESVLHMDPDFPYIHYFLGHVYLGKSLYEKALSEFEKERAISGAPGQNTETYIGIIYSKMGKTDKAREILDYLVKQSRQQYISAWNIAVLYFALGDLDDGFRWLEKAFEDHVVELLGFKIDMEFDSVRSDPRYTVLLKKMGLD